MDFQHQKIRLVRCDCLELLQGIPDNSIDLIATDPPYYKVKADDWDRQWPTKAAFFTWLEEVLKEYHRVLKPTGSLYIFCGPYLAAETELLVGKHFRVLNHIAWRKPSGRHNGCNKESLTKYFPQTERIIFAESKKRRDFQHEPIRSHIADTLTRAGVTSKHVNEATGTKMSGHWVGRSQFTLPSESHYNTLKRLAPGLKPYKQLHSEYVAIRERMGRTGRYFAVTKHVPYTDVWDFPVVQPYPGKHPCEKPLPLMRHIIEASSRPDDVVLDTFVGSGSTAIAAARLGRQFIGCEMGETEFNQAKERITHSLTTGGKEASIWTLSDKGERHEHPD